MKINGTEVKVVETDLLIIGTEATGGKAALEAADLFPDCRITVVNKQIIARSAVTITAVATYNAAVNPDDHPDIHTADTINGGGHLADQTLTKIMCDLGPQCVHEMEAWGCKFARQEKNRELFDCFEYPGHSKARGTYTFPYGTTGRKMVQIMKRQLFKRPNVQILNDTYISDMLMADGRCVGALGVSLVNTQPIVIRAKAVIIGAGGGMEIFKNSDAARDATGNGYGWAYRAGSTLIDMELVQFFPTNVVTPKTMYAQQPVAVIRYALGARLYNNKGERFMHRYDPVRGEYSTRDLTSRAMWMEILAGRGGPQRRGLSLCRASARQRHRQLGRQEQPGLQLRRREARGGGRRHQARRPRSRSDGALLPGRHPDQRAVRVGHPRHVRRGRGRGQPPRREPPGRKRPHRLPGLRQNCGRRGREIRLDPRGARARQRGSGPGPGRKDRRHVQARGGNRPPM